MADQSPDPWRVLWRNATSEEVLVTLLLATAISVMLTAWIPQQPASDADYARWLSQTQARFGEATPTLRALGLFRITSSLWFRGLLALIFGSVFLRLVEGVDRLRRHREVQLPRGEWRPMPGRQITGLLKHARQRSYRVVSASSFYQVDRWPWSDLVPLFAYAGALLLLVSLLLMQLFGWQVDGFVLQAGERRSLPGSGNWVKLAAAGCETEASPGVVSFMEESGPGMRISARTADGEPISLLLTSDAEPKDELHVALTKDTYFAIPSEQLVVRLTPRSDEPYALVDVRILRSPNGQVMLEKVTDKGGQATFNLEGTTVAFEPAPYARVAAARNPGRFVAWGGSILVALGVVGSLMIPERRFWLRENGEATEAYGSVPTWAQHGRERA